MFLILKYCLLLIWHQYVFYLERRSNIKQHLKNDWRKYTNKLKLTKSRIEPTNPDSITNSSAIWDRNIFKNIFVRKIEPFLNFY